MGDGSLPANLTTPNEANSINTKVNGMPTSTDGNRKPLIIAGEEIPPPPHKPTDGMPTFGTMRPGVSFKNIVTQNAASFKKDEGKTIVTEATPATGGGGTLLKFGSFNASLPLRVQSAPPSLEEELPPTAPKTLLEVTPEGDATQFVRAPAPPTSFIPAVTIENVRPFVPASEARPFYPQLSSTPYYGGNMNYAPYPPMGGYYGAPRPHYGNPGYYAQPPPQGYYQPGPSPYRSYIPYQQVPPPSNISMLPTEVDSSASNVPLAVVPPAPRKKIAIVDPSTGQEVVFNPVPKNNKPIDSTPAEIQPPLTQATPSVPPVSAPEDIDPTSVASNEALLTSNLTSSPRKPVLLIDPESNQPVDLGKLIEKVETNAQQEQDLEVEKASKIIIPTHTVVEHLLEEIDEDDVFSGGVSVDEDFNREISSEGEEEEEEEEFPTDIQFPVILTRNIKVNYPVGSIPFNFPAEGEPLKYTTEFLLQFAPHCLGVAQDIASVAFPKDIPTERTTRRSGRGGRTGRTSGSNRRQLPIEHETLTNRAEDAWKRASSMAIDEDLVVLREVKQILNKLTEDKFEKLTEQILAVGVLNSAVMTGVIDMLFDKAVEEPRYAPLYARLCSRISKHEVEERMKTLPVEEHAAAATNSLFRKCLVTKCQIEYQAKRAYSKQRMERLMAKQLAEEDLEAEKTKENDSSSNTLPLKTKLPEPNAIPTAPKYSGELTEEDYVLIKMKRRVLGNMRFIGELYIAGLIPAKIMHTVIQELLGEIVNPEEEEVESVCRLIPTIGSMLDTAESALVWGKYVDRLRFLTTNTKLPTRVRFMVQDVLELREHGWRKIKLSNPTTSSSSLPQRRDSRDNRDRVRGDIRQEQNQQQSQRRSGSLTVSSSTRGGGQDARFERAGTPKLQNRARSDDQIPRPSSTVSRTSQESLNNRFLALEQDQEHAVEHQPDEEGGATLESPAESVDLLIDEKALGKLTTAFDETLSQKNFDDITLIMKELPCSARSAGLKTLLLHSMDKGRKHVNVLLAELLPRLLQATAEEESQPLLSTFVVDAALHNTLDMIDDLVVDIPNALEYAGSVAAIFLDAERLTLASLVESVLIGVIERDPVPVGKIVLYTLAASSQSVESKRNMIEQSHKLLQNCVYSERDSLSSLATKLGVVEVLSL